MPFSPLCRVLSALFFDVPLTCLLRAVDGPLTHLFRPPRCFFLSFSCTFALPFFPPPLFFFVPFFHVPRVLSARFLLSPGRGWLLREGRSWRVFLVCFSCVWRETRVSPGGGWLLLAGGRRGVSCCRWVSLGVAGCRWVAPGRGWLLVAGCWWLVAVAGW